MDKIKQWILALNCKIIAKLRRNNKKFGVKCTAFEMSKAMEWHKQERDKMLYSAMDEAMKREGKL